MSCTPDARCLHRVRDLRRRIVEDLASTRGEEAVLVEPPRQ